MNIDNLKKYIPENTKADFTNNAAIFEVPASGIIEYVSDLAKKPGFSLKLMTATDERNDGQGFRVWYVIGAPSEKAFFIPFIRLKDTVDFPSLASSIHIAWNYEKKIHTFFGLNPVGHPDLRPIIVHENWPQDAFPLRKDFGWQTRLEDAKGSYEFQKIEGEGIYEIPVGPIHAGIIEPGHFRFSCAGEEIVYLEPRLGYTHKGSEKLFEILPLEDKVRLSEKISGDSSFSHSLAFCQALEELAGIKITKRAEYLRLIFAELERLANHFGDIGAIMIDTGFNFGGANGARLREMVVQANERLTGSRFLRGVNAIGGVNKDISDDEKDKLAKDLALILKDFSEVIDIAENSASLFNRLKSTGKMSLDNGLEHGALGVAGRAVGLEFDTRWDFPYAAYEEVRLERIETEPEGDVCARFYVRIKEARAAMRLIQNALATLPKGEIKVSAAGLSFKKNALAISAVEGWRGEIACFVATDSKGEISRVFPRDPSFHNWLVVGGAGLTNIVPDFPLINKSFNLSYTGYDL